MSIEEFINEIKLLGLDPTKEQLQLLENYCDYLLEYNEHTNLTAIRNKEDVYLKHFYDSLTIIKSIDLNNYSTLLDIGSGAGFPGVVLKIFYPNLNITLIDSNNKKTTFLSLLIDKLQLTNISVIHTRIEEFAKYNLNKFDIVTARAVTNMRVLSEISLPLVKENGYFIAMKGNIEKELDEALTTISLMGGTIEDIIKFTIAQTDNRSLVKIKKIRATISKELRPYDKITKKPLQK